MKTTNTISPYKVYWVEFRAQKGIVTKKDAKILAKYICEHNGKNGTRLHQHFASKEMALAYLEQLDTTRLGKAYEVRLMTDKQFSLGKRDFSLPRSNDRHYSYPFTQEQEKAMYVIGNNK